MSSFILLVLLIFAYFEPIFGHRDYNDFFPNIDHSLGAIGHTNNVNSEENSFGESFEKHGMLAYYLHHQDFVLVLIYTVCVVTCINSHLQYVRWCMFVHF